MDQSSPKTSLRHVLEADPEREKTPHAETPSSQLQTPSEQLPPPSSNGPASRSSGLGPSNAQNTGAMTTSTRRNANGSVSSVYSGNRIENLKKVDGTPFWRKDIQYKFLRIVFEDEKKVFTKLSDGTSGHTFAEVYVDAMAKSSKCSQILKDKLLTDSAAAVNMAMICLLVNVGRMNTTLNFFPEMRARVRTYHAIPVLQANQNAQAYKQLQDGPRLKSILKGAMEDTAQPATLEDVMRAAKPRTNPVNLVFVLSQYAPKISELHFAPPRDFFDLFIRPTLSSATRANAFLWMMWWYLESDFTEADSQNNPFGKGVAAPGDEISIRVPPLDVLTDEEAAQENLDTEEEIAFGEAKKQERLAILRNGMPPAASTSRRGQKTAMMEQQQNYRFRPSPFSTDASDSGGGSRGTSPSRKTRVDPVTGSIIYNLDQDRTKTSSPTPHSVPPTKSLGHGLTPPSGVSINTLLNEEGKHHSKESISNSPPRAARRSAGRVSWSRKSKEPPLAPFEQVMSQATANQRSLSGTEIRRTSSSHRLAPEDGSKHRVSSGGRHRDQNHETPSRSQAGRSREPRGLYLPLSGPLPDHGGTTGSHANSTSAMGMKRSRLPTAHQQAIHQSRQSRVYYLLDRSMRMQQKLKRKERSRRGVVVDAWVKARALPDGWDSEDDEPRRIGGIDDIRSDPIPIVGDAGERATELAKGWRRLGKALDGVNIERLRRKSGRDEIGGRDEDRASTHIHGDGDGLAASTTREKPSASQPPKKRRFVRRRFPTLVGRRRTQRAKAQNNVEQGVPVNEWRQSKEENVEAQEDAKNSVEAGDNSQDEEANENEDMAEESENEGEHSDGDVAMVDA